MLGELYVLDVGCGVNPVGDVNCDLFVEDTEGHRTILHNERFKLDQRKVSNFVCCDAQYLPFKSGCFDLVNSRQVIEHVKHPELMAKDMVRVSRDLIVIETVHRRGERLMPKVERRWISKVHVNKFDYSYFGKLAKMLNVHLVQSEALTWNPVIQLFGFSFLRMPCVIRVIFSKNCGDWGLYWMSGLDAKRRYLEFVGL